VALYTHNSHVYLKVNIIHVHVNLQSHFHGRVFTEHWSLVYDFSAPHFQVLHFPDLTFGSAFSDPVCLVDPIAVAVTNFILP